MDNIPFILTADLHMGIKQYGSSLRENHFYNAVNHIVNYAIENNINNICVAGDALDSIYPSQNTMKVVKDIHKRLCENKISMYISSGNHDNTKDSWFNILEPNEYGIKCVDDKYIKTESGLYIYGIKSYSKKSILDALNNDVPEDTDIILIHTNCKEFLTYDANKSGNSNTFSVHDFPFDKFKREKPVYVCIGDTHITKQININNVTFVSPGSTEMTKSNEDIVKYFFERKTSGEFTQTQIEHDYIRLRTDGVIRNEKDLEDFLTFFDSNQKKAIADKGAVIYVYYDPIVKDEVINRTNALLFPYKNVIAKYIPAVVKDNKDGTKTIVTSTEGIENIMTLTEFVGNQTDKYKLSDDGNTLIQALINPNLESIEGSVTTYLEQKGITL